jgi:hypothetical protein
MNSLTRPVVLLALLAFAAWSTPVAAQISVGGFNSGGNQSDDDDNQGNNQNSNRQGSRRSKSGNQNNQSGGNSTSEQIQQMLLQGQGGQGGQNPNFQGGSNRSQRNQNQFNQNQNNQNNQLHGIQIQQGQLPGARRTGNFGNWQGNQWQGSRSAKNWVQLYGGDNNQPFSSKWYNDHPKAWKYNNNNANVWVVGSLPGVYGWLGWGDVPQEYHVHQGDHGDHFDHSHYGDWYPLGVYSLMAGPGDMGTRMVQLAIDRHGHIAGNYYDMITNSNYSVSGEVSRQSQRVSWSLNKNQGIRFRTHISQLMQPYGTITVRLPGGEQQWQFVRLEN